MQRLKAGDELARGELVERCLPPLRRWARGRLPGYARDLADTDDLVQVALMRAVERLPRLEVGAVGSFLAYMRQVLLNEVRDELRRHRRRPAAQPLEAGAEEVPETAGPASDPILLAAYEQGLDALTLEQREAVVLRLEFGLTFPEIALELGLPSADAARMRVSRGLTELAERMPR